MVTIAAVHLDAAHARLATVGQQLEAILRRDAAARQRAGDQHAEAAQVKRAVERQPRRPQRALRRTLHVSRQRGQRRAQVGDALAGHARHRDDGRAGEAGALERLGELERRDVAQLGLDQVDLGERDHAGRDAEQRADREVLARLRHHALVGRHHQDHQIDAAQPRQRVVHEALVTGHVDEAELDVALDQMREPDVDGDAADALLLPAIAVDAGERLDQRGLAVVDVPRGADHDAAGGERQRVDLGHEGERISARDAIHRRSVGGAAEALHHLLHHRPDPARAGEAALGHQLADRLAQIVLRHLRREVALEVLRPRAAPCPGARAACPARTAARPPGAA